MREYLSEYTIASSIKMLRTTFAGSFLLVEGDTDARLFRRFVDLTLCFIQNCYNRDNVLKVISIVEGESFPGCLGVVDRDFGEMLSEKIESDNVIVLNVNDMETMLLVSDAFESFVAEYANSEKVSALEATEGSSLRQILIRSAGEIGALRFLSRCHRWNLDFKEFKIKYVHRRELTVDLDAQIEHLRGRSPGTCMPAKEAVKDLIASVRTAFPDPLLRTHGHDICEFLAKGIHDVFGRAHLQLGRSGTAVEETLRAAFSSENFRSSALYADIKTWELNNRPYHVLRS